MLSINDFLDNVLVDFEQYVRSGNSLCKLHDAHFDAGRIPDYSDKNIQQLYLLRYAYAYAFEYKYMYKDLFSTFRPSDEMSVTSVGCGSFLDYWALTRVVRDDCSIYYRGIDQIKWYYRFPLRKFDNGFFYQENAVDFFTDDKQPSDIYIFPKSISEFSLSEISQIVNSFDLISQKKDRVFFLFSLRKDRGSLNRDLQRTNMIYNGMISNGFRCDEKAGSCWCFEEEIQGEKIRIVDSDFKHPGDVVDCLKELYTNCQTFESCKEAEECKARLGRWPILNCEYAAWQIFSFEK